MLAVLHTTLETLVLALVAHVILTTYWMALDNARSMVAEAIEGHPVIGGDVIRVRAYIYCDTLSARPRRKSIGDVLSGAKFPCRHPQRQVAPSASFSDENIRVFIVGLWIESCTFKR